MSHTTDSGLAVIENERNCANAPRRGIAWLGILLALFFAAPLAAAEQARPIAEGAAANDEDRWPYDLPFLADEALKRGYELPLPRGLSALYYYVERDIEINDVRLGINGAPLRNVSKFVNLGSKSHVNVAVARFDAWLSPCRRRGEQVGAQASPKVKAGAIRRCCASRTPAGMPGPTGAQKSANTNPVAPPGKCVAACMRRDAPASPVKKVGSEKAAGLKRSSGLI
jgi:hypothetical protein